MNVRNLFPLQSGLKIDIIDLLTQDYFSGENNPESEYCKASYRAAKDYIKTLGLTQEHESTILDNMSSHASDTETQGFVAGVQYGFSIWESLKK